MFSIQPKIGIFSFACISARIVENEHGDTTMEGTIEEVNDFCWDPELLRASYSSVYLYIDLG
jgi:hypothetical protein